MKAIESVQEVFDAMQRGKENATAFCTNFYPSPARLETWIANKTLKMQCSQGVTFLLQKDRDFWHLYYCASDTSALSEGMGKLPLLRSERVVVDVLCTREALATLLPVMQNAGLRPYKELARMARSAPQEAQPVQRNLGNDAILIAERQDERDVLNLIEAAFDPYAKHIPSLEEIRAAIDRCEILILRHTTDIAGLLFFETHGVTSTLRFWTVREGFRDAHLGSELMGHYLASQTAVRRFVLWVNTDNEDALRKYRHYHYATDGVLDYVLANESIPR